MLFRVRVLSYLIPIALMMLLLIAGAFGLVLAHRALTPQTVIPIVGMPRGQWSFDGGWIDPARHLLYQSDRSQRQVDVIDLAEHKQIAHIAGFAGVGADHSENGPNHMLGLPGNRLVVSDGDPHKALHVFDVSDPKQSTQLTLLDLGGRKRTDALAYAPQSSLLLAVNGDDPAPFVSLIDTGTMKVVKQLHFPDMASLDDVAYDASSQTFLLSATGTPTSKNPYGAIVEISPKSRSVIWTYHLTFPCDPAGLAIHDHTIGIGCSSGSPLLLYRQSNHASTISQVAGVSGGDLIVWTQNHFVFAAQGDRAGSALVVISPLGKVTARIATAPLSHSVIADPSNPGVVYVPETGKGIVVVGI